MRQVAVAEVKDDLSRFLRLAESEEIVIAQHGKPAGVLVGFASEEDWFDYRSTGLALPLRKPDTPDRRNRFGSDEATQPQPRQSPTRRIRYHRSTLLYFSHDRSSQVW
jgi:prevent-host-death family protein